LRDPLPHPGYLIVTRGIPSSTFGDAELIAAARTRLAMLYGIVRANKAENRDVVRVVAILTRF
jgi:hypothetical protein